MVGEGVITAGLSFNNSEAVKARYFQFVDFWSIPYKKNCHNFRNSDHIDMKLRPVTKIDKRNNKCQKKLTITSFLKTVTPLLFF